MWFDKLDLISICVTSLINDLPQVSQQQQIQVTNEVINPSPLMAANEALGGSFGYLF